MKALNSRDLEHSIAVNSIVQVFTKNDPRIPNPEFRDMSVLGYWQGVKPNPKVNAALRDPDNGFHWLAEVYETETGETWDLHLEFIETINVLG